MEAVFNSENVNILNQLLFELKYSLSKIKDKDLKKIIIVLIKDSATATYKNKKDILLSTADFVNKKIKSYREKGIKKALNDDYNSIKSLVMQLPEKYEIFINQINSLSKEQKIELIISIIFAIVIFYAASGGSNLEGGIPDLDIEIGGIGIHRSIWFHSIIAGLTFEFLLRLAYNILIEIINNLPNHHLTVWDKIKDFIDKNRNLSIAAMWLGISAHLLKDTALISGNFKTYADLPVGLSTEYHKSLMAANSFASAIFGANNIK